MEMILCLVAAFLGQAFSILYNVRDYLKTSTFDWNIWKQRNLPEAITSLLMAIIAAYFFVLTEFRFFAETFGLSLNELGEMGSCFVIGLLLDTVINMVSKLGIRKSK